MRHRPFRQVDVFSGASYRGNPLAVVLDGDGLDAEQMQEFARWTNLSETTFVLPPSDETADYRVRIFTPTLELPFAGHPTFGTAAVLAATGKTPQRPDVVVQECDAGLIEVRRGAGQLAFAAQPLRRSGPVDERLVSDLAAAMGLRRGDVVDAAWVDNGPGWVGLLLADADRVLQVRPTFIDEDVGLVGPYPDGAPQAFEVRGFFPKDGVLIEDPVTGSLNASLAMWLTETGRATTPYIASQGTAMGRAGRVHVSRDEHGTLWVGGGTVTCIDGQVEL